MIDSLKEYCALLVRYLRPHRGKLLLLAVLLVGGTGLQAAVPLAIRYFIDTATAQGALSQLYLAALLFLAGGFVSQLLPALSTYVGEDISWRATNRLRSDLTSHVLRLDMSFHNARTTGELIERIDGDVTKLANFFSAFAVRLLGSFLWALGIVIALGWVDWRLGLALAAFIVVYLIASSRVYGRAVSRWHAESENRAELYGYLGDRVPGIKDIRTSGAVDYVMRGFHSGLRDAFKALVRACRAEAVGMYVAHMTWFLAYAAALGLGIFLFQRAEITIGTVYLILHYLESIRSPITQVVSEIEDLQRARASIARVRELLAVHSALADGNRALLPDAGLSVQLDRVSFSYEANNQVLGDISLDISAGRAVGVLGRTGSGKTTLSRLLFRLYDPDRGAIRLNGVDIRDLPLGHLRRRLGMVTQDVQLFQATVRDNLTLFDPLVGDDRILENLEQLGLGRWYGALPRGLDTELAAGGGGFSAGEAQLFAFARVFLKDPRLVILDEATSRLDPDTERLIERAVEGLVAGRTALIIAHRLATVQRLDDIVILERGRIEECGERKSLMADPHSRFSRLLQTGLEEALA